MITSTKNPLIKKYLALRDKKDRSLYKLFTIEGEKEILHAVKNGIVLDTVLFTPELMKGNQQLRSAGSIQSFIEQQPKPRPGMMELSSSAYRKIAYRQNVEGIAVLAKLPERNLGNLNLSDNPLLLILHNIEKPGNLGALLRTADGAGVDAVLVISETGADLYNPNVIRASLGAIFTLPVLSVDLKTLRDWLKARHITTVMTTPDTDQPYSAADLTGPIAIVLGSEDEGLPHNWLAEESCLVNIPMRGQMDSLNVSCAGAIVLYEAIRQRHSSR